MVVSSLPHLLEQAAVQFQRSGQVIQGLLVALGLQVGLPELRIGSHQQEYVFLVDRHKHFAYGQALNPSVDEVFGDSLALNRKPLKGMQSVLQRAAYALVN